jgi:hypothetical protein
MSANIRIAVLVASFTGASNSDLRSMQSRARRNRNQQRQSRLPQRKQTRVNGYLGVEAGPSQHRARMHQRQLIPPSA